jgi:hypothetical protein
MISFPLLNAHELTPFFSPSLLRIEGECTNMQLLTPPLCIAERGTGGEFMGKEILLGAISFYTEGLIHELLSSKSLSENPSNANKIFYFYLTRKLTLN